MRVVQLIVFAIWPVHAVLLFADDSATLLRQAEQKFAQGEFAEAVELTSQVINDEAASNTAYLVCRSCTRRSADGSVEDPRSGERSYDRVSAVGHAVHGETLSID